MSKNHHVPIPVKSTTDKNLNNSEELLAAIVALTKAIQGTNLRSPDNTATPATAPKAQQITFQYRSRTIAANSNFTDYVTGNFFFMFSNSNANQLTAFQVSLNNDSLQACPAKFKFKSSYTRLNFFNSDSAAANIVYFVGSGDIDYES